MKEYQKSEHHLVRSPGEASGEEFSKLSDNELSRYLENESFQEEKKKYRIKSDFILREIAGEYAIVPVGSDNAFSNAMLSPNSTAVFLWKAFEKGSTIQDVIVKAIREFDVAEDKLRESIHQFVKESLKYQVLEEEE